MYEFEHFRPGMAARPSAYADNPVEQPVKMAEEGVIDLMDFDMDPDEEEKIRRSLEEKTKYKEVAPTWELNIEKYGTYRSVGERLNSARYRLADRNEFLKVVCNENKRRVQGGGAHLGAQY